MTDRPWWFEGLKQGLAEYVSGRYEREGDEMNLDPREKTRPMSTPIVMTVDDNTDGRRITIHAQFVAARDEENTICLQCFDVMAFDNGDGDPITGVLIELTYADAEELVRELTRAMR